MRFGYLLACLGALTLWAANCQAQLPRGGSRVGPSFTNDTFFRLLDMQKVRLELDLRNSQVKMLDDLQADLGEQLQAAFPRGDAGGPRGFRDPAAAERARRQRSEKILSAFRKIRDQGEKLVGVVLDPAQTERLNQIRLQDEGPRALDRESVRKQLAVTDDQFSKLEALRQEKGDRSLSRSRQRRKLEDDLLAVLSDEQQKKFKALQGDAFEFPLLRSDDLQGLKDPRRDNRPRRP